MKKLLFSNSFLAFVSSFFLLVLLVSCNAKKIVVSNKSKYKTIQAAINAVPSNNSKPFRIFVKNGIYKERLIIDTRKDFIELVGENKDSTIISFNYHSGTKLSNGDTLNTWTCASVFIYASNFIATNICFENNAGYSAGQAVAVRVDGDRCAFYNCKFLGNQDVLFLQASGTRQYFNNCYIEGTTDFIFGASTAIFDSCTIHSKKNSHVTAASTIGIVPYGFVFRNCTLTADSLINKVSLGRPWSPTASVAYLNCNLGKHILSEGWNNWKNPAHELTVRYSEYNSFGPGANDAKRVKWSKQLTSSEAANFNFESIFLSWKPLP
jgi:pectinesterase